MKMKMLHLKRFPVALLLAAAAMLSIHGVAGNGGHRHATKTEQPPLETYYLLKWRPLPPMIDLTFAESSWLANEIPVAYANPGLTALTSPATYRGWLAFPSAACRTEFLNKRVHPTGTATYTYSRYYELDGAYNSTTTSANVLVIACNILE
ncbi:hypothetical protein ECE50_000490 [Chitinophaga sp. Mgbs1]|uniref:Uncharacterized protein n=1 Tax=Chitinophaga solisilvae TaxID=1233460 RepID=A0A3S1BF94_9BACT|nr:hypothetical protein [Chitinophaga solisilvae]